MANLYKKLIVVTDPKTGQKVKTKSKKWWGRYRDESGTERRVPLAADKMAAQAMLNELVKRAERRAAGVVDRFEEHRKRPLANHLTDFERHLKDKGISQEQVKLVASRTRRIVEGCKAALVGDLSASRVQAFLAQMREQGKSVQTSNHYLRAIKQFTRWLIKDRRALLDDPLAHLAMLNVATDRRHVRRPFSEAELIAILRAANVGQIVRRVHGPDRAMLYAVAAYTGFRASELASLTRESFDLDFDPPTVTVQAAYSKHRRQDVLPLHPSLVVLLRPWLASKSVNEPVWPGNWAKGKQAGVMLQHDLEAAGIPYVDESGRYADFHALRHTFITNLVKSGVSPKAAQSLARHSTIDLTMNVYTSLTVQDQASAVASLPKIPAPDRVESGTEAMQGTGTDGLQKVPTVVPRGAENGAIRPASKASEVSPDCIGSGSRLNEEQGAKTARNPEENGGHRAKLHPVAPNCTAEGEGFEPSTAFRRCRFSRPVQSATLPPLRVILSRILSRGLRCNSTWTGLETTVSGWPVRSPV